MKFKFMCMLLTIFLTCGISFAQTNRIDTVAVEDFKPASTNQPGNNILKSIPKAGSVRAFRHLRHTKSSWISAL